MSCRDSKKESIQLKKKQTPLGPTPIYPKLIGYKTFSNSLFYCNQLRIFEYGMS